MLTGGEMGQQHIVITDGNLPPGAQVKQTAVVKLGSESRISFLLWSREAVQPALPCLTSSRFY